MCTPEAIMMTMASTAVSVRQQRIAQSQQEKAQKEQTKAEQQRARDSFSAQRVKEQQQNIAAARKQAQVAKKARIKKARASVAAGEAGVSGLSVDAIMQDMDRQKGEYRSTINQQMDFAQTSAAFRRDDMMNQNRQNLLSINRPIAPVDIAGAAVDGASLGLSYYNSVPESMGGKPS